MARLTRRSVIRSSIGLVAAGTLARPYIANAQATTAEVWWAQGFVPEEDVAIKKIVADYEKASGNKIDLSIMPFAPQRQKIVAAMTERRRPGFMFQQPGRDHCAVCLGRQAGRCQRRRGDAKGGVHRNRAAQQPTATTTTTKKRSLLRRAAAPQDVLPNHIWRPLVEKAGYKMEDVPKTWDAYLRFLQGGPEKAAAQGMRNVYGLGLNVTTNGDDPNNVFNYFLIAYGGQDIVTKDGKLHLDDPKVKEAVDQGADLSDRRPTRKGFVPPGAINWNDADDNNAFHAKQIVMDLDGTISTEVAVLSQGKKEDYDDIVTMGLALEQ